MTPKQLVLPHIVFGKVEVRRLRRELAGLEDYLHQAGLRRAANLDKNDKNQYTAAPKASRSLEALAGENHLQLDNAQDRSALNAFLQQVESSAPVLHFSFAADPSAAFMARLTAWLRTNIHPLALISLGLQPSIAAGCIVRTANKTFDFSLRERLQHESKKLGELLHQQPTGPQAPATTRPTSTKLSTNEGRHE